MCLSMHCDTSLHHLVLCCQMLTGKIVQTFCITPKVISMSHTPFNFCHFLSRCHFSFSAPLPGCLPHLLQMLEVGSLHRFHTHRSCCSALSDLNWRSCFPSKHWRRIYFSVCPPFTLSFIHLLIFFHHRYLSFQLFLLTIWLQRPFFGLWDDLQQGCLATRLAPLKMSENMQEHERSIKKSHHTQPTKYKIKTKQLLINSHWSGHQTWLACMWHLSFS